MLPGPALCVSLVLNLDISGQEGSTLDPICCFWPTALWASLCLAALLSLSSERPGRRFSSAERRIGITATYAEVV